LEGRKRMQIEFEESSITEPYMKVVFDAYSSIWSQRISWENFKEKVDKWLKQAEKEESKEK
jgi:hypothetical protein